jgi:predicted class III extradiol MEMO1 family dioxygenase
MEIVKQNESFTLKDSNEVYELNGSINRSISGSLNIHFSVNQVEGGRVGDCSYNKYSESGDVNFSVNCVEGKRDEFTSYADTVIDSVLEQLQSI